MCLNSSKSLTVYSQFKISTIVDEKQTKNGYAWVYSQFKISTIVDTLLTFHLLIVYSQFKISTIVDMGYILMLIITSIANLKFLLL